VSGATGFGMGPSGYGPKGLRADQPPPNQADDLHAIRVRYVGPKTLSVQNINLAANAAIRFDLTGTPVNAVILTTATGQLNLYFGDYTSGAGKAAVTPHVVGTASIVANSEVIPIPPAQDYIFTVQEGAAAAGGATGTIIFIYQ
jgi:hypothetical protein